MATKKVTKPAATKKSAAPAKKNRVNSFSPSKVQDTTIVDSEGKTVGHIRVKPSGVLWAPSNSKVWYGLSLDQLATVAMEQGKKQKK
jgi:hypothetical protein